MKMSSSYFLTQYFLLVRNPSRNCKCSFLLPSYLAHVFGLQTGVLPSSNCACFLHVEGQGFTIKLYNNYGEMKW